jgi:hypothetical protein
VHCSTRTALERLVHRPFIERTGSALVRIENFVDDLAISASSPRYDPHQISSG